ncbi:transglycosylase SLT domain-containing protein [Thermodesulfobacteriota bacterium]
MRKIIIVLLLLIIPCQTHAFERYNRVVKFDRYFSKYSKRFFGTNFDWRYFKAQAVAESGLKVEAKSKVGAKGLMQIMPKTYQEIMRKNPSIKGRRSQPRWNIAAGIYYDRSLWNEWKAERPVTDRINFMFGSYNAGKGNIIKAQRIAKGMNLNENLWEAVEASLPEVTGKNSRETIGYVQKINKVKEVLR